VGDDNRAARQHRARLARSSQPRFVVLSSLAVADQGRKCLQGGVVVVVIVVVVESVKGLLLLLMGLLLLLLIMIMMVQNGPDAGIRRGELEEPRAHAVGHQAPPGHQGGLLTIGPRGVCAPGLQQQERPRHANAQADQDVRENGNRMPGSVRASV